MTTPVAQQMSLEDGLRLRRKGHRQVEGKYPAIMSEWRDLAVLICERDGDVDTDRLQALIPRPVGVSPNALGAVLKEPTFVCIGHKPSARMLARHRHIGVWALRSASHQHIRHSGFRPASDEGGETDRTDHHRSGSLTEC